MTKKRLEAFAKWGAEHSHDPVRFAEFVAVAKLLDENIALRRACELARKHRQATRAIVSTRREEELDDALAAVGLPVKE